MDDVLSMVTVPVIVSHAGVRGTCDHRRNLGDRHLKAVAETGGVIGIAFFERVMKDLCCVRERELFATTRACAWRFV